MKALTKSEAKNWTAHALLLQDEDGDLRFHKGLNLCHTVPLPDQPHRITNLASYLLRSSWRSPFVESLLWFTDWGMWNDHHERVGYKMLELMGKALGESRRLIEAPAYLFSSEEEVEAQSYLTVAILINWNAYLVPKTGDYFVFNSHHEFIEVISNQEAVHRSFSEHLKDWGAQECER